MTGGDPAAAGRLCVYNGGFAHPRIRRILGLAGWRLRFGLPPGPGDAVGVWGRGPTAWRGEAMARRTGAPLVRIEDAPLRSLFPGRAEGRWRGGPTGLLIDRRGGVHFDASAPSDLDCLLAEDPLDDPGLIARAGRLRQAWCAMDLSKYAATDPSLPLPDGPFTLVIDQARGDASVTVSGGGQDTFRRMLAAAAAGGLPVVVKTHPETAQGQRPGYLGAKDLPTGATRLDAPVSVAALMARAGEVHTYSSGLGFEAILHGVRPHVWGTPFYAGWGLTEDRAALPRRGRQLHADQMTAAALILAPTWYDPVTDRLCTPEDALRQIAAEARAWREDRAGWSIEGQRRWKRPHLRRFFGRYGPVRFAPARAGQRRMVWGAAPAEGPVTRVEDGFLRSRGLGARLVPPASLCLDDLGIYFDPDRESRLERLIAESGTLPPVEIERVRALIASITAAPLSKYNIGGVSLPPMPPGRRVLVAGQVGDDASVRLGAGEVARNADLLARARAARPDAVVVYAPHPDVTAGLRPGRIEAAGPDMIADVVAEGVSAAALIGAVDEVWTMTSLLGFEALLRGVPVTVTGAPFYAGWGLTTDTGATPARRTARPTLEGLAHATLIGYPRYNDPATGLPCPPETIVARLAAGKTPGTGGWLSVLQDLRRFIRR